MSAEHFDNVARVIAHEMVAAGLSESVAPAPAALAASRILGGEPAGKVIPELVASYRRAEPELAKPTGPEPTHVRVARDAGKVAPTTRTTADRVSAALAGGNPWATGNITHQQLVGHLDPKRAARLKREAGR